ncbi:MAG TPA: hypothetical protein VK530_01765 [Candidatus Acidoferrum sp.]|nr:hypothetical protein [Candidatus Acidoferrum sp.]
MKMSVHRLNRGFLNIELAIALGVLVAVVLPIALSFRHEAHALRTLYRDAVAMQIVDGEMDVLAAGKWKATPQGRHVYTPRAAALKNLPRGEFIVTRDTKTIRLEWLPNRGRKIKREVQLP